MSANTGTPAKMATETNGTADMQLVIANALFVIHADCWAEALP